MRLVHVASLLEFPVKIMIFLFPFKFQSRSMLFITFTALTLPYYYIVNNSLNGDFKNRANLDKKNYAQFRLNLQIETSIKIRHFSKFVNAQNVL